MLDLLSLWIIKQLFNAASDPIRKRLSEKFSKLILGDPLQRALQEPTKVALEAAIACALGEDATEEQHKRAFDILEMFWNDDLNVSSGPINATITEALHIIVASGINRANAPIEGLPAECPPTTSLTSLSDELGIPMIDADAFAATFTTRWLNAIRDESLTNKDLQQLALLLSDEKTQHQMAGSEERLSETVRSAVQSLLEHVHRDGELASDQRRQWFEKYIVPAHQLMEEIAADYQSGFSETLEALQSGQRLEATMQRLKVMRRRKIMGRADLEIIAEKLESNPRLFGTSLDGPLTKYVEAVQAFKSSDSPLNSTWYSYYIDEFSRLAERGEDPRDRSKYAISGLVRDLEGHLARQLEIVVDRALPERWKAYKAAYVDLEKAAEATA
ncbi:hypothetical protein [Mycolicibacterium sp. 120270]|uniref:hypothetical protein n=1 Tax=Mycolicibacterium sp. 120270 TaxID=3090600 RepID=UPI00299CD65E|nr:hypothetical protein [Mycolicibacterium sp. 120270]MDX1886534.1 hypothetical protein [Mycolicibacterium sp. 120270]